MEPVHIAIIAALAVWFIGAAVFFGINMANLSSKKNVITDGKYAGIVVSAVLLSAIWPVTIVLGAVSVAKGGNKELTS